MYRSSCEDVVLRLFAVFLAVLLAVLLGSGVNEVELVVSACGLTGVCAGINIYS